MHWCAMLLCVKCEIVPNSEGAPLVNFACVWINYIRL